MKDGRTHKRTAVVLTSTRVTYQTSGIAIGHDVIHKNSQMSVVLPQFGQRFEHAMVVDLTLLVGKKRQENESRITNVC